MVGTGNLNFSIETKWFASVAELYMNDCPICFVIRQLFVVPGVHTERERVDVLSTLSPG